MKDLSLHILDILENSIEAKANHVELYIWEDKKKNLLTIKITDDGKGIKQSMLPQVGNPFVTTKEEPNAGLGLYLLKCEAEAADGTLIITSERGKGTTVIATFQYDSKNRKPLGNIADSLAAFIIRAGDIELKYIHLKGTKEYTFDTKKIKKELGLLTTQSTELIDSLKSFITKHVPQELMQ